MRIWNAWSLLRVDEAHRQGAMCSALDRLILVDLLVLAPADLACYVAPALCSFASVEALLW
jgi:hypothetical protein